MKSIVVFISLLLIASCDQMELIPKRNYPVCFKTILAQFNSPVEIWSYKYENQTVYLTIPDCCDQYIQLYTSNCSKICAPSGGFTGKGDGKCPDFYDKATNGILIWKKK